MDKYDPAKRVRAVCRRMGHLVRLRAGVDAGLPVSAEHLRDAHVAALTLNIFHRHTDRVKLAAIAQMVNVLQAMILTDGPRMVLTPTYHVFDMYMPFQGATPLSATVEAPRIATAPWRCRRSTCRRRATRRASSSCRWSISTPSGRRGLSRDIAGMAARGAAGRLLTGPAIDTHNSFDQPDRIRPVAFSGRVQGDRLVFELPAKSVAVVEVR